MGLLAQTARAVRGATVGLGGYAPLAVSPWQHGRAELPDAKFETYAREGYSTNEIVFSCIEALATSAAEPRMRFRQAKAWYYEGRILDLMRNPNPFMDGFEFWATVILYRALAGNAYGLKVRSASGKVVELWLMRPDRVRIVPDSQEFIRHFEYDTGVGEPVKIPVADVIHWKTRNPVSDFYGMPPLMAAAPRVDIDNYMKDFVKSYFTNAGVPAGLLSLKGPLNEDGKKEIKRRFRNDYGGARGWHELLIIDNTEATFTPMTQNLGPSGLIVPELNKLSATRICAVFGVPPALLGLDDAPTSYAAMEMVQRFFWDNTLAPLYKDLAGPMNSRPGDTRRMGLTVDFGGVDEIGFDLTDVRALREDVDKVQARERANLMACGMTVEEFREASGRPGPIPDGTFLVPANMMAVSGADLRAGRVTVAPSGPVPASEDAP